MGFHLSGTDWTGQEAKGGRESEKEGVNQKRDKEAGGQRGNGNERPQSDTQTVEGLTND